MVEHVVRRGAGTPAQVGRVGSGSDIQFHALGPERIVVVVAVQADQVHAGVQVGEVGRSVLGLGQGP